MQAEAYKLGYLDAALDFGLTKESWAKAIVPAMMAGTGALLAPEGERLQGAMLFGGAGLAGQSAVLAGANKLKGAFTPKPNPHAATPGGTQMAQTAKLPEHLADLHKWNKQEGMAAQAHHQYVNEMASTNAELAKLNPPGPQPQITPETIAASKRNGTDPALVTAMMHAPKPKEAALQQFKLSLDLSSSVGVPGAGVSFGLKDQRERLPGMSRWVPRSTVERGFDYADQGLDDEAVADLEADRGSIGHPLLGAALAAAGARKLMPYSGALGPILAGLGGAGLGALYHKGTMSRRTEEGVEALNGAQREREKFPIRRHKTQTANESTPLAISRGNGDA
jgi:hypothetical protein